MLTENAIAFAQDRSSREWTFNYYMDNATAGIGRLAETWRDLQDILTPKQGDYKKGLTSPQRRWNRCQRALDKAIKYLAEELRK